jgi:hypothetical protein
VDYDGYSPGTFWSQLIALPPGRHTVTGQAYRTTEGPSHLAWIVLCADDYRLLATASDRTSAPGRWETFSVDFSVPPSGCEGQWLRLVGEPAERRTTIEAWYDKLGVEPIGGSRGSQG